jgi:hypothetical protein
MACLMPEHDMFVLMIAMLGIGILCSVIFLFLWFLLYIPLVDDVVLSLCLKVQIICLHIL